MHPIDGNQSRGDRSSFEYFITQWRSYLGYMRIWFWPRNLNADSATLEFSKSLGDFQTIQAGIGNFLILFFAHRWRKKIPAFFYGMLWFYITISPASSVVVLAEAMNEHRMYLAYIGFVGGVFTVLAYGVKILFKFNIFKKNSILTYYFIVFSFLAIFTVLIIGTQERNRVWANEESLWKDTLEKNPTSGRALNNLALVYLERGQYSQANEYLLSCEKFWDSYMYCPLNLGVSYFSMAKNAELAGDRAKAATSFRLGEEAFLRAYQLNPQGIVTNFYLGRVQEDLKKDYFAAIRYYREAIRLSGGRYSAAEVNMANCYYELGQVDEAWAGLYSVLTLEPQNENALLLKEKLEAKQRK